MESVEIDNLKKEQKKKMSADEYIKDSKDYDKKLTKKLEGDY